MGRARGGVRACDSPTVKPSRIAHGGLPFGDGRGALHNCPRAARALETSSDAPNRKIGASLAVFWELERRYLAARSRP
jgi:hypothetical protein